MADSPDKNPQKAPAPGPSPGKAQSTQISHWTAIFPTVPQQTAFMLFWGFVILGMIVWMLTARGRQLIDIDHAEFRETRFLVDINSAGPLEFSCLPGIGKKTASSIVRYRDENGPFESVESLAEVSGVSLRLVESLKTFLYIPAPKELAEDNRGIP